MTRKSFFRYLSGLFVLPFVNCKECKPCEPPELEEKRILITGITRDHEGFLHLKRSFERELKSEGAHSIFFQDHEEGILVIACREKK